MSSKRRQPRGTPKRAENPSVRAPEGAQPGALEQRLRRSAVAQAVAIGAIAFLIRALHLRFAAGSPLFQAPTADEWEHWSLAQKLAAGNWLGEGLGPYFRPQLFAYVLAVLQLFTGASPALTHFLLALMDAATVGVLYLVARKVWPRRAAVLGSLCVALYWPLVYFAGTFNKESLAIHLQAWMLLALAGWVRAAGRQARRPGRLAVLTGILAGLGLLVRPPLLLPWLGMLALMIPVQLARRERPGRAFRNCALALGAAILILVPLAVRNFTVGGAPVLYSTHGGLNLYLANNARGDGFHVHTPGVAWDLFIERPQLEADVAPGDYAATDAYWRRQFLAYVTEQPGAFLAGLARKAALVVNAREEGITNSLRVMRELSPPLRWLPGTGLLLPVALLGIVVWLRRGRGRGGLRRRTGTLLLVFAALSLAGAALVFPVTRDRLAGMSVLLLFGGAGILAVIHAFSLRGPGRRGAAAGLGPRWGTLAALGAAALVAHLPVRGVAPPDLEAWLAEINRGDALIMLWDRERQPRQLSGSIAAYERALTMRPEGLQPLKQLPAAYVRAGREGDALAAQERLVERLRRDYAKNRVVRGRELEVLGRLGLRARRPEVAETAAREWAELDPEALGPLDLRIAALTVQGRREEARAVLSERLRRAPGDPDGERLLELIEGTTVPRQ